MVLPEQITDQVRDAAHRYLDSLKPLKISSDCEPDIPDKGYSRNEGLRWLEWHAAHGPIAAEHSDAAERFKNLIGVESRHPFTLTPAAEAIILTEQ